jgi:hypothetical protein
VKTYSKTSPGQPKGRRVSGFPLHETRSPRLLCRRTSSQSCGLGNWQHAWHNWRNGAGIHMWLFFQPADERAHPWQATSKLSTRKNKRRTFSQRGLMRRMRSSHQTHPWRKADSNSRSHLRGQWQNRKRPLCAGCLACWERRGRGPWTCSTVSRSPRQPLP